MGAAIGVAAFGPFLGSADGPRDGFLVRVLVAAGATVVALVLTLADRVAVHGGVGGAGAAGATA